MSKGLVERDSLTAIANAIRSKTGNNNTYTPAEMAPAILELASSFSSTLIDNPRYFYAEIGSIINKLAPIRN